MNDNCIQVFIACPSDVDIFVGKIKEKISSLNKDKLPGDVSLRPVHFNSDYYPDFNKEYYEAIDSQLLKASDALIAVFWTQIGTPLNINGKSEKSGTVHEVNIFLRLNKQIFLYFLDMPVRVSKIDCDQLQKLKEFQEKDCYGKCIRTVKTVKDLLEQIGSDLETWIKNKYKSQDQLNSADSKSVRISKYKDDIVSYIITV